MVFQNSTIRKHFVYLWLFSTRFILWIFIFTFLSCVESESPAPAATPRIVAFSPALAALTCDVGLGDHLVGVSAFCHLPKSRMVPVLGHALNVRMEPILAVQPDVLLIQMDPHHFAPLLAVSPRIRIEHFTIETLANIAESMTRIGSLVGQEEKANAARQHFEDKIAGFRNAVEGRSKPQVLFVLGFQNPAAPGGGTFIDELIDVAGGINIMSQEYQGWQNPSLETLIHLDPKVIVCQTDRARQTDATAYWTRMGNQNQKTRTVFAVTDPTWTIPSARIVDHIEELIHMLHPELDPATGAEP